MTRADPFRVLGLSVTATADEVRRARRRLAAESHPDAGGDTATMSAINAAAAEALRRLAAPTSGSLDASADRAPTGGSAAGRQREGFGTPSGRRREEPDGLRSDVPSFVVEALPAVAFEALTLAAAELGEIADDDPPYRLWALLDEPRCWCRLDVVPDAGASTVSLSIAPTEALDRPAPEPLPAIESVRDAWIHALNGLDWSTL